MKTNDEYRVYLINHSRYSDRTYPTLQDAVDAVRKAGLEASVYHDGVLVASWSVFGGLHLHG